MEEVVDYQAERRKVLDPFFSWDAQIEFCHKMEGWEVSRMEEAVAAFHYLRQVLGEEFPMKILDTDHPMGQYFVNDVPWTKEWFIRLASSLQVLAGSENIGKVIKDLRSPDLQRFEDAQVLLHYGLKFSQVGYQVDFEQKVLNGRGEFKYPDLKLTDQNTGTIYYCEIARLEKDPLTILHESVIDRIVHGGVQQNKKMLKFSGALHQRVTKEEFGEIAAGIQQLICRTAKDGRLHEWVEEGLIELAVADYHDPAIQDWAAAHKLDVNAWKLPPSDPSIRIKNKIWHKTDQSAADFLTFLIIKIEDGSLRQASPTEWINDLDQIMQRCRDTVAVWLTIFEFGGLENVVKKIDAHYFMSRTEGYALGSLSLGIFNRYHKDATLNIEKWSQLFNKLV